MENPGVYLSPTEGWAFVPFVGAVVAVGLLVGAILFWCGGEALRVKAVLVTALAAIVSVASVWGLVAAATSFDQRNDAAFREHAALVQAWAAHEYGATLTQSDAENLVTGRPATAEIGRRVVEVRLRPIPGSTGVYLVGPSGTAVP